MTTIMRGVSVRRLAILLALSACAPRRQPTPAEAATQELNAWRQGRQSVYMDDFGELKHFRAANAMLKAPAAGEKRVVFYGDSITDLWPLAAAFPGKSYVNRGIAGQTTSQLLVRLRADVIALAPEAVVILAGTNDIAGNTGPISLEEIEGNFASMAELARAHGIRVVLSSVLPVHNYTPISELSFRLRPPAQITALNKWLREYAAANGCVYIDYASAMTDDNGLLKRELAEDGLHPNKAGYTIMTMLAEQAIGRVLATR